MPVGRVFGEHGFGDVWTWTAICADSRLVPTWLVGPRDGQAALEFLTDLAGRLDNRVQLTTDGHKPYLGAVEDAFGADVDYAMLIKLFQEPKGKTPERKYSPGECCGTRSVPLLDRPSFMRLLDSSS